MQNPQGIAVNSFLFEENLQLGNRPFYDLFAVVIGCGWSCAGAARLHGLFPDFPGEFSPAFCLPRASPPLFLIFVSAEVGYTRRLRKCGVRGGFSSLPAPNLAPPPLRSRRAAAASGAGGESSGRESPEGAPGAEAPAGADTACLEQRAGSGCRSRAVPTWLRLRHERVSAAQSARSAAAPKGLQQRPRATHASSLAASG